MTKTEKKGKLIAENDLWVERISIVFHLFQEMYENGSLQKAKGGLVR